jgi:hypothetical protein
VTTRKGKYTARNRSELRDLWEYQKIPEDEIQKKLLIEEESRKTKW